MHLTEISEVIKASPAIQIQSKITHLQRRVWNVLLANAYNELPNTDIHRVSVAELAKSLGFNSRDSEHLKETLEALVDCTVKWNILEKDKEVEWGVASLLANAKIRDGICTYSFAPELRYKLYNPRVYAKLNLHLQNRFTSRYALILWEVCFDYFDRVREAGETPFIPLKDFRELMGLEKKAYPDFKVLNRNVVKESIQEINELTNYHVEVELKRIGRKVGELKFRISKPKEITVSEPIQESLYPDIQDLPRVALELVQAGVDRNMAVGIAEQDWGFVAPEKVPPPGTYPDFATYVVEKIELSHHARDVKNRGGFIVEAIREHYIDPEAEARRKAEKAREQQALLNTLRSERDEKVAVLIQQAVRQTPELLEKAATQLPAFARRRLDDYESVQAAYQAGGMVAGTLKGVLAEDFCAELLAPVYEAYEDEKARILGEVGRND